MMTTDTSPAPAAIPMSRVNVAVPGWEPELRIETMAAAPTASRGRTRSVCERAVRGWSSRSAVTRISSTRAPHADGPLPRATATAAGEHATTTTAITAPVATDIDSA